MEAFCAEIKILIQRHQTEAVLQMTEQKMDDENVWSLLNLYKSPAGDAGSVSGSAGGHFSPHLRNRHALTALATQAKVVKESQVWYVCCCLCLSLFVFRCIYVCDECVCV